MYYCEKCDNTYCCERTDIWGEPVLFDKCYKKAKAKARKRILKLIFIIGFFALISMD